MDICVPTETGTGSWDPSPTNVSVYVTEVPHDPTLSLQSLVTLYGRKGEVPMIRWVSGTEVNLRVRRPKGPTLHPLPRRVVGTVPTGDTRTLLQDDRN